MPKHDNNMSKSWWQRDLDWVDEVMLPDGAVNIEPGTLTISLEGFSFVVTVESEDEDIEDELRRIEGPISSILWVAGDPEED